MPPTPGMTAAPPTPSATATPTVPATGGTSSVYRVVVSFTSDTLGTLALPCMFAMLITLACTGWITDCNR